MNLSVLLPSWRNLERLWEDQFWFLLANWWSTLSVAVSASLVALAATVLVAFVIVRWPVIKKPLGPFLAASQSFPLQAVAPLIIIVMGTGFLTKFTIAALIAFFPMFASYSSSLETVPLRYIRYAGLCGATPWQIIYHIRFRHSLPQLASSAKVGFTLATLGAVVAEFIQPDEGLGRILLIAQSDFNAALIYACIFLLLVQGVTVFTSLQSIEGRLAARRAQND
jgi:ABC-type nitrate/sulfonate/bicarbonate transport system permease component